MPINYDSNRIRKRKQFSLSPKAIELLENYGENASQLVDTQIVEFFFKSECRTETYFAKRMDRAGFEPAASTMPRRSPLYGPSLNKIAEIIVGI